MEQCADKPPQSTRGLHCGFPCTSATKATHGAVRHGRMPGWARRYANMSDGGRSVRPPLLTGPRSGGEACLSSEVKLLLLDLVADGFVRYCCRPKTAPCAPLAFYQWENYVDLVTIRSFDRVTTAWIPARQHSRIDVFTPEVVVWAQEGPPQCPLRELLDLLHPQHPDAPELAGPPADRIVLDESLPDPHDQP
jgi:hypothetical protein